MAGAPKGNQNAAKGRMWRDALRYSLAKIGRDVPPEVDGEAADMRGLRKLSDKFIQAAEAGESWALKELADRIDGKAVQGVELSGPDGDAMEMKWTVEVVDAKDSATE